MPMTSEVSQQDFLRQAMKTLGKAREEFAELIGANPRALKNWLLPDDSLGHRKMPSTVRKAVELFLERTNK